jgi:nitrogen fixation protein NifM
MSKDPHLAYALLRLSAETFGRGPGEIQEHQRQALLQAAREELRLHRLVAATPEAACVSVAESVIDEAVGAAMSRYDSPESFALDLESVGLNTGSYRDALRQDLTMHAVLDWVGSRAPTATEEEIERAYRRNVDRLVEPETRETLHLLITVNPDFAENTEERALERIAHIRREVLEFPDRFGAAAHWNSECPSALKEGRIGRIRPGQLRPELDRVLFALSEGELSPVTQTTLGFHLLRCEEINPARAPSIQEAAPGLAEAIHRGRRKMARRAFLTRLLREAQV